MVQVLPYVPSFLERLFPQLQQSIRTGTEALEQRTAMKGLEAMFNPQSAGQPVNTGASPVENLSPLNAVKTFKLAEKALGPEAAKVLIGQMTESAKLKDKEAMEIRKEERLKSAEEKKALHEKKERQGNIQKTFNVASSMLAKGTPGVGISPGAATGLSRSAVEGRNAFNSLKGKFESILLPMVNKGTLAKERFNFILSQIPDAGESNRAQAGKLRGLAETLSEEGFPIDTKILDSIPWVSEELKSLGKEEAALQKVEAGTKLTEDAAKQLLKQAGNDKAKARQLAKELGYEF